MKIRNSFVSNLSSSSFIITNISGEEKSLVDFVKENPQLIEQFVEEYDWHKVEEYNQENLIKSAEENNIFWKPGEIKVCIFGDENYEVLISGVFDYILRDGGTSESFEWRFHESLR